MYTTDNTEGALDDIRKVFLLYDRGIIRDYEVKDYTKKIVDLYVTKSLRSIDNGQTKES